MRWLKKQLARAQNAQKMQAQARDAESSDVTDESSSDGDGGGSASDSGPDVAETSAANKKRGLAIRKTRDGLQVHKKLASSNRKLLANVTPGVLQATDNQEVAVVAASTGAQEVVVQASGKVDIKDYWKNTMGQVDRKVALDVIKKVVNDFLDNDPAMKALARQDQPYTPYTGLPFTTCKSLWASITNICPDLPKSVMQFKLAEIFLRG